MHILRFHHEAQTSASLLDWTRAEDYDWWGKRALHPQQRDQRAVFSLKVQRWHVRSGVCQCRPRSKHEGDDSMKTACTAVPAIIAIIHQHTVHSKLRSHVATKTQSPPILLARFGPMRLCPPLQNEIQVEGLLYLHNGDNPAHISEAQVQGITQGLPGSDLSWN